MHEPLYPDATFVIGKTRKGQQVTLSPMSEAAAEQLGAAAATFDPWLTYGFSPAAMTRAFLPATDGAARYQTLVDGAVAGALVIRPVWLIGPYLQTIAVLPAHQNSGIGGLMLDWFEARARAGKQRNIWLCVAGFNTHAQRFYAAHGWHHLADLPDLIRDGIDEQMLRKRIIDP